MEEKDLEKLTATKLREIAKQYEGISGAHAMKKEDLIREIHKARGDTAPLKLKKDKPEQKSNAKKEIKALKEKKQAANEKKDRKTSSLLRKKIKKYRRLTRKLAKAKKA